MQMKMLMSVDMIKRQACCSKATKLSSYFRPDLAAADRIEKNLGTKARHISAQMTVVLDEVCNLGRRQKGRRFNQCQMKANPQARRLTRKLDRLATVWRTNHQACCREHSVAMGDDNSFVNFASKPKIIGSNNKALQCTASRLPSSRRSRRNWKNSTPSRRRRFIMVGLTTISPTIEAILPARK